MDNFTFLARHHAGAGAGLVRARISVPKIHVRQDDGKISEHGVALVVHLPKGWVRVLLEDRILFGQENQLLSGMGAKAEQSIQGILAEQARAHQPTPAVK